MTDTTRDPTLADISLPELDLNRPAGKQIFEALKSAILRMELKPGCLVSENEIGQKVGASRTPVREAFTQLRQDGLIVTRPSRGNYVSKLSEQRIREAQFIREGLELNNVRRLCANGIDATDLTILRNILKRQQDFISNDDDIGFQKQDDRFHEALAASTGFSRASTLLQREKVVLDRLRVLSLADQERKTRLHEEHMATLKAIIERDVDLAVSRMQTHLGSVLNDLSSLVRAHRNFFE